MSRLARPTTPAAPRLRPEPIQRQGRGPPRLVARTGSTNFDQVRPARRVSRTSEARLRERGWAARAGVRQVRGVNGANGESENQEIGDEGLYDRRRLSATRHRRSSHRDRRRLRVLRGQVAQIGRTRPGQRSKDSPNSRNISVTFRPRAPAPSVFDPLGFARSRATDGAWRRRAWNAIGLAFRTLA